MKMTTISQRLSLPNQAVLFDLEKLMIVYNACLINETGGGNATHWRLCS
jgi:hypothetical protein